MEFIGCPELAPKRELRNERFPVNEFYLSRKVIDLKENFIIQTSETRDSTSLLLLASYNVGGGGTGRRETERKGGGRCTGGRRRGGGKRNSQGGGKREKKGKIMQRCAIFRNQKNSNGREPKNTGREPRLKGTGSGRFKPPCPPPPLQREYLSFSHKMFPNIKKHQKRV